jgi:O-succinylbenzoic acid--CoA ligase
MVDKMIQPWQKLHPEFKLNGLPIALEALEDVAYSLTKEGETFEREYGEFLLDWLDQSDDIVVKTSGSTGEPKNFVVKKEHFLASARLTGEVFELFPGNRTLLGIPGSFIAGKMMFVRALVLGLDLLVVRPSKNPLKETSRRFHFVAMTPYQLANSLDEINRVDTLLIGGAPFPKSLELRLKSYKGKVVESYGMTETLTHIALREVHPNVQKGFTAIPGVSFCVDDRSCLAINAPHLGLENLQTEDLVELHDELHFVWKDRLDRVINTGGIKVFPGQIEYKIDPFIEARFFVGSQSHEQWGEQVVLYVEGNRPNPDVISAVRSVSDYEKGEKPKAIYWISVFRELHSGKVDRLGTQNVPPVSITEI